MGQPWRSSSSSRIGLSFVAYVILTYLTRGSDAERLGQHGAMKLHQNNNKPPPSGHRREREGLHNLISRATESQCKHLKHSSNLWIPID